MEVLVVQPNLDYTGQEIVENNMHVVDVAQITSILKIQIYGNWTVSRKL